MTLSSAFYTTTFVQTGLPENAPILAGALLDIPVFDKETDFQTLDKFVFHVSTNIRLPAREGGEEGSFSAFDGLGVSEIVGRDGYSYANSRANVLDIVNPFYEVQRSGPQGVFEGFEKNVSIKLVFSEEADGQKGTLIHAWPDRPPNVRKFLRLGGPYKIPDLSWL